jgi:hypothetical protein
VAEALNGVGRARIALGQPQLARADLERALAVQAARDPDAVTTARTQEALAEALWGSERAQRGRALQLAREARQTYVRAGDEASDDLVRVEAWLTERNDR